MDSDCTDKYGGDGGYEKETTDVLGQGSSSFEEKLR